MVGTRQQLVQGLRDLADFFEQHEEVIIPGWSQNLIVFPDGEDTKDSLVAIAHAMGNARKNFTDELASLQKDFGPFLTLVAYAYRAKVCERVVVGTKVLPAEPERVIPATPERTEEVVEWRCVPLLAEPQGEVPEPVEPVAS